MNEAAQIASELVKEAEARHRENGSTYFDALHQIIQVCNDNSGPTCRHDMALAFVRQIAVRALPPR